MIRAEPATSASLPPAPIPNWKIALLLLVSVASYAAAFPPWNLWWLAWLALCPLFFLLRVLPISRAVCVGLLWGIGSNFAVGYWVAGAISTYYEQPLWWGIAFCVATSLVYWSPYYALFAGLAAWTRRYCSDSAWCGWVAALWVAAEYGRANLLGGAPWLMLGYALGPSDNLRQAAALGGVYLLSFVAVAVNATLAVVAETYGRRRSTTAAMRSPTPYAAILATAAIVVGLHVYGMIALRATIPNQPQVPIAVIQGNNQDAAYWLPGAYAKGLEEYLRMSSQALLETHPRLLIWPEAAVTMFFAQEPQARARVAAMLGTGDAELLLGAPHVSGDDPALPRFLNSAFVFSVNNEIRGRYDKRHLMPFVEYFPLRTIELLRRNFERVRTFTPGTEAVLLDTPMGKAAIAICFEGIFPDLVRRSMNLGAAVLVNLSNDVWLGPGAGAAQHVSMIRMRAVENRTWVIRSTTTGVSAIFDPFGKVNAASATFTPAVLAAQVVPLQIETVYEHFGDIFAYACLAASGLLLVSGLLRSGRGEVRQP